MSDWKLVPVEPTGDMLNLLWLELGDHPCREHAMDAWRSALAAAPDAPVEIVPRVWREALRELAFMARTSGGAVGPDAGLQAACAKAEALLAKPYNYQQSAARECPPPGVCPQCGSDCNERDELIKAEREVERLRADAERYRFLRSDFRTGSADINGQHAWVYGRNFSLRGPSLDAAIDAARAAQEDTK